MKVRMSPAYTIDPKNVDMVHRAVHLYINAMESLRGWVEDKCKNLAGNQVAVANIDEELKAYREISLDIYEKSFSKNTNMPVEREP